MSLEKSWKEIKRTNRLHSKSRIKIKNTQQKSEERREIQAASMLMLYQNVDWSVHTHTRFCKIEEQGARGGRRQWESGKSGKYGYLLGIVPMECLKSVFFILIFFFI